MIQEDIIKTLFNRVLDTYNLNVVTIVEGIFSLVGEKYTVIIGTGRDGVTLYYVTRDANGELEEYCIDSFVKKEFDDNDRQGYGNPQGLQEILLAKLRINVAGLMNHWGSLLMGEMDWVDSYKACELGGVVRRPNSVVSLVLDPLLN